MMMRDEKDLRVLQENIEGCSTVHKIPGIEGKLCGGSRVSFIDPVCNLLIEAVHGRSIDELPPTRDRVEYNYGSKENYRRPANKLQDTSGNRAADDLTQFTPAPQTFSRSDTSCCQSPSVHTTR